MKLRNQLGIDQQAHKHKPWERNILTSLAAIFVLQFFMEEKFRLPPMFLSYKFSHALSEIIKMNFL